MAKYDAKHSKDIKPLNSTMNNVADPYPSFKSLVAKVYAKEEFYDSICSILVSNVNDKKKHTPIYLEDLEVGHVTHVYITNTLNDYLVVTASIVLTNYSKDLLRHIYDNVLLHNQILNLNYHFDDNNDLKFRFDLLV